MPTPCRNNPLGIIAATLPFLFLTISVALLAAPLECQAADQANRAVAAVRKLVAEGAVPRNAVLKIVVKQGNVNNFWGQDFELKNEWERQTGIRLDASTQPQKPVLEFMRRNREFDITIARQREYPDLFTGHFIADLTPLMKRFGFTWDENPVNGYYLLRAQSEFDRKIVAIPADGDIAVLYLRRDLLEDPRNRKAFKDQYRHELAVPQTWDQYQEQVEFFHDPERGFYGSCEEREPNTGWMFWMPRYVDKALPNQYLFDDDMHPLIDSPAGIAATESYVKTVPFSPPGILKEGNNYSYTVPIFRRGDCYSNIITMAGAKIYSSEGSKVKGKFICAPLPGTVTEGWLISRPSFIYGNNLVVAAASPQKELAFLYAMWLTDPDISLRSIQVISGFADPYRFNHLIDERTAAIYTGEALDNLKGQLLHAVPAGTGLPGDSEYIAALDRNIWLAAQAKLTAAEAMRRTADSWEKITQKYGRENQIRYWKTFREKFPLHAEPSVGKQIR